MQTTNTASRVNWCLRRASALMKDSSQSRALHVSSPSIQRAMPTPAAGGYRRDPQALVRAGHQFRQQVAKDGLRTFIEKVTAKPREARMWLKYFKSLAVWDQGQAFCVLHITEDVFYNIKTLETFAWSAAFLLQNGMRPVIVFGTQRGKKENMQDIENKLEVLGSRLQKILTNYGAESSFFTSCNQVVMLNSKRTLCVDEVTMTETLESHVIPIVTNLVSDETAEQQFRLFDPIRVAEVVAQATRPLKVMLLSPEKGIQDCDGKIVSDIVLPSDLPRVQENDWYKGDAKSKIERIGKLLESLPNESSVIMTSADTVIQELFTHHGSGTMIKRSEKVMCFDSLAKVDLVELGLLISESFQKPLPETYFQEIEEHVDRIYITESYTAAAIVVNDPAIGLPYLDKFAVKTSAQGLGISAQVWTDMVKDYRQLFWRSREANKSANSWYNSVCQGSWKDNQWIVYWYGMPSCKEVFPLIDYALKRPETFDYAATPSDDIDLLTAWKKSSPLRRGAHTDSFEAKSEEDEPSSAELQPNSNPLHVCAEV